MSGEFYNHSDAGQDDLMMQTFFIRYLEDRMNEDEVKQFSLGLRNDKALRLAFVNFMRQQVQMTELLSGSSCADVLGDFHDFTESSSISNSSTNREEVIVQGIRPAISESIESLLQDEPFSQSPPLNVAGSSLRAGIFYSFVSLVVLMTLIGVWWSKTTHIIAPQIDSLVKNFKSNSVEAETADEKSPDSKNSLLHVDSNTIRVSLPNVGYANIETPADFKMINPMLGRLTKGRINIRVTENTGAEFVIETPHGNIKNLEVKCDLNIDSDLDSGLLVRQGSVNLEMPHPGQGASWTFVKHVVQGEGITFGKSGEIRRVMSVVKAGPTSYLTPDEILNDQKLIIRGVSDNLKTGNTTKFYEIIPGGLKEDVARCVDRQESEWNGVDKQGLPQYLIGADYIKNFGDDVEQPNLEVFVTISRPAKLYVFYDERLSPPHWLKKDFRNTGDRIGSDAGRYRYSNGNIRNSVLGVGPGISIDDAYSVWERIVEEPSVVTLGSVKGLVHNKRIIRSIYGIAAVALERESKDMKQ